VDKNWEILAISLCISAITQARQRLRAGAMRLLFHSLLRPMVTVETVGAFINEL
jgi:hypothetical protein